MLKYQNEDENLDDKTSSLTISSITETDQSQDSLESDLTSSSSETTSEDDIIVGGPDISGARIRNFRFLNNPLEMERQIFEEDKEEEDGI